MKNECDVCGASDTSLTAESPLSSSISILIFRNANAQEPQLVELVMESCLFSHAPFISPDIIDANLGESILTPTISTSDCPLIAFAVFFVLMIDVDSGT